MPSGTCLGRAKAAQLRILRAPRADVSVSASRRLCQSKSVPIKQANEARTPEAFTVRLPRHGGTQKVPEQQCSALTRRAAL